MEVHLKICLRLFHTELLVIALALVKHKNWVEYLFFVMTANANAITK